MLYLYIPITWGMMIPYFQLVILCDRMDYTISHFPELSLLSLINICTTILRIVYLLY